MSAKEILEKLRAEGKVAEAQALEAEINSLIGENATYRSKNKELVDFIGLPNTANLQEELSKKKAEEEARKKADADAEKKRLESLSEKDRILEELKKSNEDTQAILKQIQEEKEQAKRESRTSGLKNTLHSEFDKLKIRTELKGDALDLVMNKVKDLGDKFVLNLNGQEVELSEGLTKFFDERKHYIQDTQAQGANTSGKTSNGNNSQFQKVIPPSVPFSRSVNAKVLEALDGDK